MGFNAQSGSGVTHYELVEEGPTPGDVSDEGTRRFLVIDGQVGHEQLTVTLAGIKKRKAEVTIEASEDRTATVKAIPLDEVVRSAMFASGVSTGYLDPEGTNVDAGLLAPGFQPTEEIGLYAIAV